MLKTVKAGDGDGFFVEHLSYVLGQAVERGGVAGERCLDCGQPAGQLVYAIMSGETLDGLIKMFFGEFHGKRINGEGSIANGANPSRTPPPTCIGPAILPRRKSAGRSQQHMRLGPPAVSEVDSILNMRGALDCDHNALRPSPPGPPA